MRVELKLRPEESLFWGGKYKYENGLYYLELDDSVFENEEIVGAYQTERGNWYSIISTDKDTGEDYIRYYDANKDEYTDVFNSCSKLNLNDHIEKTDSLGFGNGYSFADLLAVKKDEMLGVYDVVNKEYVVELGKYEALEDKDFIDLRSFLEYPSIKYYLEDSKVVLRQGKSYADIQYKYPSIEYVKLHEQILRYVTMKKIQETEELEKSAKTEEDFEAIEKQRVEIVEKFKSEADILIAIYNMLMQEKIDERKAKLALEKYKETAIEKLDQEITADMAIESDVTLYGEVYESIETIDARLSEIKQNYIDIIKSALSIKVVDTQVEDYIAEVSALLALRKERELIKVRLDKSKEFRESAIKELGDYLDRNHLQDEEGLTND